MTKLDYERAANEVREVKKRSKPDPSLLLEDTEQPVGLMQLLFESQKKRYPFVTMQDIKTNKHFLQLVVRSVETGDSGYLTYEVKKIHDLLSKLQIVSWIDKYTRFTWVEARKRFLYERKKQHNLSELKKNPYWSVRLKVDLIREVVE